MPGPAPLRFQRTQTGGAVSKKLSLTSLWEAGLSLMKSVYVAADQAQLKQPHAMSRGQ